MGVSFAVKLLPVTLLKVKLFDWPFNVLSVDNDS